MSANLLRVDRVALLEFYDTIPRDSVGHATAINAVAGEDLGAGLLKHYLENVTAAEEVTILDQPANQGTLSGSRLDRWILVRRSNCITLARIIHETSKPQ